MKIRELIETILKNNELDDEIIVAYWDRKYFVDELEPYASELDPLWKEFVKTGQEKVNAYLDFTQTGYELVDDLEKLLEDNGKN